MEYPIRINKFLAQNNFATRNGADELIKKGYVFINGRRAVLGDQVYRDEDVTVSNKVPKKDYVYYAYNKPTSISTNPDVNTKDILQVTKFPPIPGHLLNNEKKGSVFPIGRLDKDSHGLILMTNDGRVTDRLLSPKNIHEKEYTVKVKPNFSDKFLELMTNGVHFDKFISKKCKVWRTTNKSKDTFNIILTEGKKRQIRRMCEALHHRVINLKRIRIMNIELGKLNEGEYRVINGDELDILLKSLHLR